MSRRPNSKLVRQWCFEYWVTAAGTLVCYLCGREWAKKDWHRVEAEHEIARELGLVRFGKEIDKPPNVKPCCSGNCEVEEGSAPVGHKLKTKDDVKRIAKAKRITAKTMKFKRTKNPLPGSRASGWQKKYNKETGRWETIRRSR